MKRLILVLMTIGWLVACSKPEVQRVTLPFFVGFEGKPVTCESQLQVNALTLYVHDIAVQDLQGNWQAVTLDNTSGSRWQNESIALLDLAPCAVEPMGLNALVLQVPAADYQGLRFSIGVPERFNHQDPQLAQPPLDISQLQWHWSVGYKFAYFDLAWQGNTVKHHLGSSGCVGNIGETISCEYKNRPEIILPDYQLGLPVIIELSPFFSQPGHERCFGKPQDKGCGTLFDVLGLQDAPQRIFSVAR